jgi:serine/threonine protein kinase
LLTFEQISLLLTTFVIVCRKRRWFVLKEDCLYYYASDLETIILGVMPLVKTQLWDLAKDVQDPPARAESKVCYECKKPFTLYLRKHHCRHCGNSFCHGCSDNRLQITKFGYNAKVRVCNNCTEILQNEEVERKEMATKADQTEKNNKQNEIDEDQEEEDANNDTNANNEQLSDLKPRNYNSNHAAAAKLRKFTLPEVNKPHLFSLKNSERELWLHADSEKERLAWVTAIKKILDKHNKPAEKGKENKENKLVKQQPQNPWEVDAKSLTILNKIAAGAFGEVHKGRLWGTDICVKTLKTEEFSSSEKVLEELKKEVSILSQLRHPNVVLYIGACTKPPDVCIITEWCNRGSLFDVLHDHSIHINAKATISLMMGIAQGMNYLHSLQSKIIHRDLKSHNILISGSTAGQFVAKIADFGLSHVREKHHRDNTVNPRASVDLSLKIGSNKSVQPTNQHYGIFGTPEWMAPEVMEGSIYTEKIDIYSFGILLSELVTRSMPFHDLYTIKSYMDVVDAVLDNGAIPTIPAWCENFIRPLILSCVSRIPSERPSFTDIILKIREFYDLDESVYFFQFDLPRLRELMNNSTPSIQALAANELAETFTMNKKIRRIADPSHISHSFRSPNNIYTRSSSANIPTPFNNQRTSPGLSPSLPPTSPISPLISPSSPSSPLIPANQDLWILDDEDAAEFLERLTALLSSSHQIVQSAACRALSALLLCGDKSKRAQDRELIISEGGIPALLVLLESENFEIVDVAGEVLLLLTKDLPTHEFQTFLNTDAPGLARFIHIIKDDIQFIIEEARELQTDLNKKQELAGLVDKIVVEQAARAAQRGKTELTKPNSTRNRAGQRTVHFPLEEASNNRAAPNNPSDSEHSAGESEPKKSIEQLGSMNSKPLTSAERARLALHEELLAKIASPAPLAENYSEYFGETNILRHGWALRFDPDRDNWKLYFLVLLREELRLFDSAADPPDDSIMVIRTVDSEGNPAAVRLGSKLGMPNCVILEDCGIFYTFCAGTAAQQTAWKEAIEKKGGVPGNHHNTLLTPEQGSREMSKSKSKSSTTKSSNNANLANHSPNFRSSHLAKAQDNNSDSDVDAPALSPAANNSFNLEKKVSAQFPAPTEETNVAVEKLRAARYNSVWNSFIKYYGRVSLAGWLWRQKKYSMKWVKQFFVLVDSELHYYENERSTPAQPEGTFYICTNSGKEFLCQESNKKPHCFSLQNPSTTAYLSAESKEDYGAWRTLIRHNVKKVQDNIAAKFVSSQRAGGGI